MGRGKRGWRRLFAERACRRGWHRVLLRQHGPLPGTKPDPRLQVAQPPLYVRRAATLGTGTIVYRFSRRPNDEHARTVQDFEGGGFTCAECGEPI